MWNYCSASTLLVSTPSFDANQKRMMGIIAVNGRSPELWGYSLKLTWNISQKYMESVPPMFIASWVMAIDLANLATFVFSSLEHVRRCKGILENDPDMWSIMHSYQFQIHSQTPNRHSNPVDQLQGVGQTPEQKKHTESFTVKKTSST